MRCLLLLAIPMALLPGASARDPAIKIEDFVFIQKGPLPIIVSAPHGGRGWPWRRLHTPGGADRRRVSGGTYT